MIDLRRDLAYGMRSLRRTPAFSGAAILTLAIGIGAATAIFSVVNATLLRPLPYPESDRLVRLVEHFTGAAPGRVFQRGPTHREFLEWRARTRTLTDAIAVIGMVQRMVPTAQGTAGLWGAMVSGDTFPLLGARPALGRLLGPGDERSPDVAVLAFDTWQRHFQGSPAILGTTLELRAPQQPPRLVTVVGVLAAGSYLPTGRPDFFLPIALDPSRPSPRVTMIARLRKGVSLDDAVAEANVLGAAIASARPAGAPPLPGPRFDILQLKAQAVRELRPALRLLLAAVAMVLLIVCANVASLVLARGTARRRELAVRVAVGASRGRIVRQILAECAVLAGVGGLLGAALAAAGVRLVKALATVEAPGILGLVFGATVLPRADEVRVDWGVLALALGLSALACLVFGLLPALQLSRTSHVSAMALRSGSGPGRATGRMRLVLVGVQLAMATVLLVGAALLGHSFARLSAADKGYDPAGVLTFQLLFPAEFSVERKAGAIDAILARLRAAPGVAAAGFARHGILITEELFIGTFVAPGQNVEEMQRDPERPRVRSISEGFLAAMGVPIDEGREFTAADGPAAAPVIVINRSAARRYFGSGPAVGRVLDWHVNDHSIQTTIVGVTADVRNEAVGAEAYPEIFMDYRQLLALFARWNEPEPRQLEAGIGFLSFAIRTRDANPARMAPLVREAVRAVDSNIGIDSMVPMSRMIANSVARERFQTVLMTVFAGVAALLAAVGIYGVLAFAVVQRTQEIGVRMALGANRTGVLLLVLRRGLAVAAVGIAAGLAAAAAASRLLEGMLFGIERLDPWTYGAVASGFLLLAGIASYVPARRATRVSPIVALRCE